MRLSEQTPPLLGATVDEIGRLGANRAGLNQPRGPKLTTTLQRFCAKIRLPDTPDGCWVWTGALSTNETITKGYASFNFGGRTRMAYRYAYERFVGEIPEGFHLDHLCRNPACVNPEHLEAVTGKVNTWRGNSPAVFHALKTECVRGHQFTPENTRVTTLENGQVRRTCRACAAMRDERGRMVGEKRKAQKAFEAGYLAAFKSDHQSCDDSFEAWWSSPAPPALGGDK